MAKIEKYIIDKVLEASRIEEVVGDFVDLKKKGVRYIGCCPFHEDRHAGSFVVYPKKQCFKCFVCNEKGGVIEFLKKHEHLSFPDAIRWLGKKYNIETDMNEFNYTPPPARPAPPPLEMLVLPMSMVTAREHNDGNTLCKWLRTIPWDNAQRARIDKVLAEYHVGTSRQGHTIWWQIDEEQRVRTGKMMLYKSDGHRYKGDGYKFDWIHASLARGIPKRDEQGKILRDEEGKVIYDKTVFKHIYDEDKQDMRQTLFGMHLLDRYPTATVCIVESEKTAVLMAIAYGNNAATLWMACGGIENLNRERLKPIIERGRKVILYPDRDGVEKWQQKANALRYRLLTVDTAPVLRWWREEDGPKADIADVVLRMICNNPHTQPMAGVEKLKEKLNLEEVDNE